MFIVEDTKMIPGLEDIAVGPENAQTPVRALLQEIGLHMKHKPSYVKTRADGSKVFCYTVRSPRSDALGDIFIQVRNEIVQQAYIAYADVLLHLVLTRSAWQVVAGRQER